MSRMNSLFSLRRFRRILNTFAWGKSMSFHQSSTIRHMYTPIILFKDWNGKASKYSASFWVQPAHYPNIRQINRDLGCVKWAVESPFGKLSPQQPSSIIILIPIAIFFKYGNYLQSKCPKFFLKWFWTPPPRGSQRIVQSTRLSHSRTAFASRLVRFCTSNEEWIQGFILISGTWINPFQSTKSNNLFNSTGKHNF